MARKPQVTRHIIHTSIVCRCLDKNTGTIFGKIFELPRVVTNKHLAIKKLREMYEDSNTRILETEDIKVKETFIAYSELEFLKFAPTIISERTLDISTDHSARKGK